MGQLLTTVDCKDIMTGILCIAEAMKVVTDSRSMFLGAKTLRLLMVCVNVLKQVCTFWIKFFTLYCKSIKQVIIGGKILDKMQINHAFLLHLNFLHLSLSV